MVLLKSEKARLGTKAHNFSLKGTDGETYSLKNFSDAEVLVVIFMCNHCPYVQAVWRRLVELQKKFLDRNVRFVGINPNLHPDYPEENMENMKKYFKEYAMNFPYLLDETQRTARKYGAVCTPDIFVYDKGRRLRYHGRIDDSWQHVEDVTKEELAEAIEVLLKGEKPSENQYPSMGCSVKWRR